MSFQELTVAVIGYGGRGRGFAEMLHLPEFNCRVVAVAEPDEVKRKMAVESWRIPPENVFEDAEAFFRRPKFCDALVNTTQDALHVSTALAAIAHAYPMLLEKPMAVTPGDCRAIADAACRAGTVLTVCHSLRYHATYAALKSLIDSGRLGEIVSFDHIEGVGDVHQTWSYVRGPWGNEARATFMLMAKSCHDLDLFQYLFDRKCERVAGFGSLSYFRRDHAPEGAPEFCLDGCPAERECPYHAAKIYLNPPWDMHLKIYPRERQLEMLRTTSIGRCVFRCDNDVVDHQVTALEYAGGLTGTFTMTAFHPGGRFTRVHGTHGFAEVNWLGETGNCGRIRLVDFRTGRRETIEVPLRQGDSHGGGDFLLLHDFLRALRSGDPDGIRSGVRQSLESHLVVFAAERARREKRLVEVSELYAPEAK